MHRLHAYRSLRGHVISRFIAVACGWHVLYRSNSDGIYRRKSYDVTLPCGISFIDTLLSLFIRARVQISFQIFTDLCPVALAFRASRRFNDRSARLRLPSTLLSDNNDARERMPNEKSPRSELIWVARENKLAV